MGIATSVSKGLDTAAEVAKPIAEFVLGKVDPNGTTSNLSVGEWMLIKFLLFIIVLAVLYYAARLTPGVRDYNWLSWIIAIVASLIVVRYLGTVALVNFAGLPTGVLGITLLGMFPFILFLFFIEGFDSRVIRIVGWVAFIVIFFGLAIYQWDALGIAGGFNLAWIYIIVAVLSILALVFDKTIRAKILMGEIMRHGEALVGLGIGDLQNDLKKWYGILGNAASSSEQVVFAQKQIKKIEERIETILRTSA